MHFTTHYPEIIKKIHSLDPIKYGKTRNYLNGDVTKLSPYISRGIISTKQVSQIILEKGYKPYEIESFLKELAWRDYFQLVWISIGNDICKDIKQTQPNFKNRKMSRAIHESKTGIHALDKGIEELKEIGYMHNHLRMYTASVACNIAKTHWTIPASWMYYHLLDADFASNTLSWQWVVGSFSNKKYFANQENINKYCNTNQINTFLDIPYENFEMLETPKILDDVIELNLKTILPKNINLQIDENLPFYIYNFYNLDCNWDMDINANRILLLEPSFFKQYPVCKNTIDFIIALSKNIENIQVFVGEFDELFNQIDSSKINFKEHPTTNHYKGIRKERDWMFENVKGYYPSFFAYWKRCEKFLKSYPTKSENYMSSLFKESDIS